MNSNLTRTVAGVLAAGMITAGAGAALAADPTDAMLRAAAEISAEYDLPAGLLLAVAEVESDFDPRCRTGACLGLMQINSRYVTEYAALAGMESWDLYDPEDSMRIAASMLADYLTRYEGDIHFALMAYNLGEYGALRKLASGVDQTGYSRKVVAGIERWADIGLPEPPEAQEDHLRDATKMMRAAVTGVWEYVKEAAAGLFQGNMGDVSTGCRFRASARKQKD